MDNKLDSRRLREGAEQLGLRLSDPAVPQLLWLVEELLRWNRKVNLTAITQPDEVVEKHLVDSLALVQALGGVTSLLDLGAGAGFPGLPVAVVCEPLQVTLVDAVAKKVGFIKHAAAQLRLAPRVRALHGRAAGSPEAEGLPRASVVVARALMDLEPWVALASSYLEPGGKVVAMMGQPPSIDRAEAAAGPALELEELRAYALPFSKAPRALVVYRSKKC